MRVRARAGSATAHYGNLDDIAWYSSNSGNKTHEVGQKQPNAFGLYDLLGSVWQWTVDWYDEKYYQVSATQNPSGPPGGTLRAVRGGSWNSNPRGARVSFRSRYGPDNRYSLVGLRCVGE
jgi:formylglycine-generating enzyme